MRLVDPALGLSFPARVGPRSPVAVVARALFLALALPAACNATGSDAGAGAAAARPPGRAEADTGVGGVSPGSVPRPEAHDASTACPIGPPLDAAPDPRTLVSWADHMLPNGDPRDLGVGLAMPAAEVTGAIDAGAWAEDSLVIRAAPSARAPVEAFYVVRSVLDRGIRTTCRGFVRVADSALQHRPNLYASGVGSLQGFPVDSITPDSAWLRVAFAVDTAFTVRHGWVSARGSPPYLPWPALFARAGSDADVTFASATTRAHPADALRRSPNGPPATVRLPTDPGDWSMYLTRVDGAWGEVRIERGDPCGEGEITKLPGRFWVKLVDRDGRPLLLLPNEGVC